MVSLQPPERRDKVAVHLKYLRVRVRRPAPPRAIRIHRQRPTSGSRCNSTLRLFQVQFALLEKQDKVPIYACSIPFFKLFLIETSAMLILRPLPSEQLFSFALAWCDTSSGERPEMKANTMCTQIAESRQRTVLLNLLWSPRTKSGHQQTELIQVEGKVVRSPRHHRR